MRNLKDYLKYYFLEDYLFNEVSKNFQRYKCLSAEEFFAVVIWKSNRNKTKIRKSLVALGQKNQTVRQITGAVYASGTGTEKLKHLLAVKGVGISIASAILTVCYPKQFTVADYRAKNSLQSFFGQKDKDIVYSTPKTYLTYVDVCKKLAKSLDITLRDFDRILWGMDFYKGKGGLKELAEGL